MLQRWYKGGKVSGNQTLPRSPALKRTQKGREDERTGRGRPAVNGIELRNLGTCWILPKVCACWKATSLAAFEASCQWRPGVEGPFARYIMSARQPVRPTEFLEGRDTPLTDE